VLEWDVGRALVNAALDSDDFVNRWGVETERDTVASALSDLLGRYLPGYDPNVLRSIREADPQRFEAMLQSGFGLMS
jgi:hypothetical protein